MTGEILIEVDHLTMAFGALVVQRDVSFAVHRGAVFAIMGPSGCGKSTLLRHMIGLLRPAEGTVRYGESDFWASSAAERAVLLRRFGVLFQGAALWSSMTIAQNVALPLEIYSAYGKAAIADQVDFKLALVGLEGAGPLYPSELSGGMRKRAALARAIAFDPDVLFLDEPSAGLDPISSRRLDDLILRLRDLLGITIVVVTHELDSIFTIADDSLFLDTASHTAVAHGNPRVLRDTCDHPVVRAFLNRREPENDGDSVEDS